MFYDFDTVYMDMRKFCKVVNAVNVIDTKLFVWNRQGVHIGQVKLNN